MYKDHSNKIRLILDWVLSIIGIVSLVSMILLVGFYISDDIINIILKVFRYSIYLFLLQELIRYFIVKNFKKYIKQRKPEIFLFLILLIDVFLPSSLINNLNSSIFHTSYEQFIFIYITFLQIVVISSISIKVLRYNDYISRIKIHPSGIFALSFAGIILIGALLLMLPKAVNAGQVISFTDALFTSTSAVCVTGLNSVDTPTTFSFLGLIIIMSLIQIGGLGVMTITTFFAVLLQGQMSIGFRVIMKEFLSNDGIAGIKYILKRIAILTLIIEGVGAIIIYFSLGGSLFEINSNLLFTGIFHSVSAFCNAGFSLYSDNLMSQTHSTYFIFPATIMFLIVLGGLGFNVISNLISLRSIKIANKPIRGQLTPNTKLVLTTTGILLFSGALMFFVIEPFEGMGFSEKLFHSIFLSVTPRTAGFNTVATEGLTTATTFLLILFMWIGASPGSTGGGIKTTTFAVASMAFINILRGREKVEVFKRHVDNSSVRKAFMIIFASLIILTIGCTLLMIFEPGKDPMNLIFEATSALGTVGLSRNLTYYIGDGSKYVLIFLMFIGRIGSLAFFLTFFKHQEESRYNLPKAKLLIG